MKPAELRALAGVAAAILAALFQAAAAINYEVGGPTGGWDLNTNFKAWTSGKSFHPGDALIFIYDSTHSIVVVTKSDYDSCTVTTPIQAFANGNTVISLLDTGKLYFLCSVPGHCEAGMKVEIDVVANSTASSPPPKSSKPPAPVSPTVSPPAPKAKSPPTLQPSSAPAPAPVPSTSIPPMVMRPTKLVSAATAQGGGKLVRAAALVGAGILVIQAL